MLESQTRRCARTALAETRAHLRKDPSAWLASIHRDSEREFRRALRDLAGPRVAHRVRAYATVFDSGPATRHGPAAPLRNLWQRRWGLGPATTARVRLQGEALRRALRWMGESYRTYTEPGAQDWYRRAAEAGDGDAAGWVAYAHAEAGRRALAVRWDRRAGELGNATSALNVGYALFYGEGIRRDRAQAAVWYRRAALGSGSRSRDKWVRHDAASAMTNLGRMYRKGEGVRKSWPLAFRWFTRAAHCGSSDAANFLAQIYDGNEGPPPRYRLALYWLRKAAARGDVHSIVSLGVHLWDGKHTRRNRPRALRLYAQGADKGNAWGTYLLGLAYREIDPPLRDLKLSRVWLRRAAARGLKEARRALRVGATLVVARGVR